MELENILGQRGKTYGSWAAKSETWLKLIELCGDPKSYPKEQWCALLLIMLKLARIIHGDKKHPDNWLDIAGYAMLGHASLEEPQND